QIKGFSKEAMDFLMNYHWPGNIRELKNVVEYSLVNCKSFAISIDDLPQYLKEGFVTENKWANKKEPVLDNKDELLEALKKSGGNIKKACEILNVSRMTLYRWLKKYKIDIDQFR
ncbi:MAG: helix-turn-helix domain-containing protein, partial [Acidobacteria bacterium]|nr:helix-turn-helix domain-containing protein [Acidobacteriota bacterium]